MKPSHYQNQEEREEQLASKAAALGRTQALTLAYWLVQRRREVELGYWQYFGARAWWKICNSRIRFADRAEDLGYNRGEFEDVF